MENSEDELYGILSMFYIKYKLTDAGISYHGLSNSGILQLYSTLLWPQFTAVQEDVKERSKKNKSDDTEMKHSKQGKSDDTEMEQSEPGGSDISSSLNTCVHNGNHSENDVDVFNCIPNEARPFEPSIIPPRYNPPYYCNSQYSHLTREEKINQLVDYHLMLKAENKYYKFPSKPSVKCGNPMSLSMWFKAQKFKSSKNLTSNFTRFLTDFSNWIQPQSQYYVYMFGTDKTEPQPHCSSRPDNVEENPSDRQLEIVPSGRQLEILPSGGNFGLNDLLNRTVIDAPPSTLSNWVDSIISTSPRSTPTQDEGAASSSRKRPLSPETISTKRKKLKRIYAVQEDVSSPPVESQSRSSAVESSEEPSVPVRAGSWLSSEFPVTAPEIKHSSILPPEIIPGKTHILCKTCWYWVIFDPKVLHYCASPPCSDSD